MTLPFGVDAAADDGAGAGARHRGGRRSADGATRPLHRHLRHGHGDAGGDAEGARRPTCRARTQDVYPPMSDFLARRGHPGVRRLRAPSTSTATSTWSSSATPSRAATPSSRRCSIARSATARCPRRSASTSCGTPRSIVIAGTHGKTTTTALTGWLLDAAAALDPSVLVGGIAQQLRRRRRRATGSAPGRDFVIEGDEYDSAFFDKTAKFLKYLPDIAVVNNVEFDHADIYADLDAVRLAFRAPREAGAAPRAAAARRRQPGRRGAGGAARAARVQTFGLGEGADWQARRPAAPAARHAFTRAPARRPPFGAFDGAAARRAQRPQRAGRDGRGARRAASTPRRDRATGCASFAGVKRRLEVVGVRRGVTVYDDFAHHPDGGRRDARGAARGASRARASGRSSSRARPRRAAASSRTTSRDAFAGADEVVIAPVFRIDAARGRAAVGAASWSPTSPARGVARAQRRRRSTTSSRPSSREARGRRPRRRHVERRLRRHPRQAARGAAP